MTTIQGDRKMKVKLKMLKKAQKFEKTVGTKWVLESGKILYELEEAGQGIFYCDIEATGNEVAYIPEYHSLFGGYYITEKNIEEGYSKVYTYNELKELIDEYGVKTSVEDLLDWLDWQHPTSLLAEIAETEEY